MPERLKGKEGKGKHPKEVTAHVFGSGKGLDQKYRIVAEHLNIATMVKI